MRACSGQKKEGMPRISRISRGLLGYDLLVFLGVQSENRIEVKISFCQLKEDQRIVVGGSQRWIREPEAAPGRPVTLSIQRGTTNFTNWNGRRIESKKRVSGTGWMSDWIRAERRVNYCSKKKKMNSRRRHKLLSRKWSNWHELQEAASREKLHSKPWKSCKRENCSDTQRDFWRAKERLRGEISRLR